MKSTLSSIVTFYATHPVDICQAFVQGNRLQSYLLAGNCTVLSFWLVAAVVGSAVFTYVLARLHHTNQLAKSNQALEQAARQGAIIEEQRKVIDEQRQLQLQYAVVKREPSDDTKHLASLYQELKQANQDIEIFLYKAYHNFLGPIATIRGICNIATMESQEASSLDYFEKVGNVADSMHSMLEQLLEVSVIHDRELIIEPVHLSKFFDDLTQDIAQETPYSEIQIKHQFSETDPLRVDTFLLKQAITKIINNTALFRRANFRPLLELTVSYEEKDDTATVLLRDDYLTIPADVSVDIFRMFYRGTQQKDDHGLGLYTARYAMRRMGGDIALLSGNQATTFCLKLPKRLDPQYQEFLELLAHYDA